MDETNIVVTFATVENGAIVIPKVYLPEGITMKVQLHLGKELEIAFFPDEPEHEECKNCPQYDSCTYVNENN